MDPSEGTEKEELDIFRNWLQGIAEEIRYWKGYIQDQGADFPGDFSFRLRPDTSVDERDPMLAETLESIGAPEVSILDVGAGPLTNVGKMLRHRRLRLYACDPLADVYARLLDTSGIHPPVRTLFADVENLSFYFGRDCFDAVHCCNALDHSYDPLGGILEMLKVLHPHGFIHLGHFENEAEHEHYEGLHQWNLTERDGDFVMWHRTAELSLREIGADMLDVATRRITLEGGRDWILAQIRKKEGVERLYSLRRPSLPAKYRLLLGERLRAHLDAIETRTPEGPEGQESANPI